MISNETKYPCPVCADKIDKTKICSTCFNTGFISIRIKPEEKRYACPNCKKSNSVRMILYHSGLMVYKCDACSYEDDVY